MRTDEEIITDLKQDHGPRNHADLEALLRIQIELSMDIRELLTEIAQQLRARK